MGLDELIERGDHDGHCEWCDEPGMTDETVYEGKFGWYCSEECFEQAERGDCSDGGGEWERRQLGISST